MINKNFKKVSKEEPIELFRGIELTFENEKEGENLFQVITKCKVGDEKSKYIMSEENINILIEVGHNDEPIEFNLWIPDSEIKNVDEKLIHLKDGKSFNYINLDLYRKWMMFNNTHYDNNYEISLNTFGLPLFYNFDFKTKNSYDVEKYLENKYSGTALINKYIRVSCQGYVNNSIDEIRFLVGDEILNKIITEGHINDKIYIKTYVPFTSIDDVSIESEWCGVYKYIRFKSGLGFYLNSKSTYEDFRFFMNQNVSGVNKEWKNDTWDDYRPDLDFDEQFKMECEEYRKISEEDQLVTLPVTEDLPW